MALPKRSLRADSRVNLLATSLRTLAFEKGPGAKLPTARDLCTTFGVSRITLDAVLDLLEFEHVIVRKQGSGLYVSPKIYRKSICVLFYSDVFHGGGNSPFWGMFWSLFSEEMERRIASKNEYFSLHMVIQASYDVSDLPEDVLMMVQSGRVHGVVAVGMDVPTLDWLGELQIPVVAFASPGNYAVYLGIELEQHVQQGISWLVMQGCRSIGLWSITHQGKNREWSSDKTAFLLNGFRASAQQLGLDVKPALIRQGPSSEGTKGYSYQEQGYFLAHEVFGQKDGERPDGLFINVDMMTSGALAAFQELGIVVPSDLHIVTHANKGSSALFNAEKYLALLEIDPVEIVQKLFELMDILLSGQKPPPALVVHPTFKVPF